VWPMPQRKTHLRPSRNRVYLVFIFHFIEITHLLLIDLELKRGFFFELFLDFNVFLLIKVEQTLFIRRRKKTHSSIKPATDK
jgi:hypothetical protein